MKFEFIETIKTFFKKIYNAVYSALFDFADVNNDGKLDKKDLKDLEKKTKDELEEIGRKLGTELDRRLTKTKLIQQIKKINKEL